MNAIAAIKSSDWILTGATLLLISLGLTMLFSLTSAQQLFSSLFIRQTVSTIIAVLIFFILSYVPYHYWRRYAVPFYLLGLAGLVFVSISGHVVRGTVSRLEFWGVQLQPSEFMKAALVITLALIFAKRQLSPARTVIISTFISGLAAIFVILEPDIGTTALLILLWFSLLIFKGIPWRTILIISLIGLIISFAAWQWFLVDYQRERILIFLDPSRDPLGAGYNVVQSIVALGSGHIVGRGLGHGSQSQLQFLPERHTDFILASIGEELGFIGIMLIVALYSALLWRLLKIIKTTHDAFGRYLAAGTFLLLLISFFVSCGMNMGLLPVTGIPLPLISYGGSNLVSTLILLAIVQSVHVHSQWIRTPPLELAHL